MYLLFFSVFLIIKKIGLCKNRITLKKKKKKKLNLKYLKKKKMGLKSLINFLILNSSILYFTIHRNNEQASETCLKILLYSYFFRSLWNLRYQNFLHKLFNHEFEIFSCSNVLICFSIFHFSYSSKL